MKQQYASANPTADLQRLTQTSQSIPVQQKSVRPSSRGSKKQPMPQNTSVQNLQAPPQFGRTFFHPNQPMNSVSQLSQVYLQQENYLIQNSTQKKSQHKFSQQDLPKATNYSVDQLDKAQLKSQLKKTPGTKATRTAYLHPNEGSLQQLTQFEKVHSSAAKTQAILQQQ